MAPIRIGLMGIGRIGRNLLRILYKNEDIRIAAISDPADHKALEYLIRFDTILGPFPEELSIGDGHLYVHGRQIPMLDGADPEDVPWGDLGVDVVIAATGQNRTRGELERYLERGAKRVVLCSPPKDPPDLTVIMGVNDDALGQEHRLVSNASCTAHCAAPILQLLQENFGIERAILSTASAYSNRHRLADVPAEDPRRGRAAAENIIPQDTNAAQVLMETLPTLRGRVTARAFGVPVPNGSLIDLVCWHDKPVSAEAINEVIRTAASGRYRNILKYEDDPIVSSDIEHTTYSSVFDSLSTMVLGDRMSKCLAWYDNSWAYAHRVVDLVRRFGEIERREAA